MLKFVGKTVRKVTAIILLATLVTVFASVLKIRNVVLAQPPFDEYIIYGTFPYTMDVAYLAEYVFGMSEPLVESIDGLYYINSSYPRYLEVYEASGSIWYADFSKMYNESYAPTLPQKEQAHIIAEEFLLQNNLLPSEAYFVGFGNTTSSVFYPDTNETETIINSLDVLFGFKLPHSVANPEDEIPVDGPGAKIRVSLGDEGEIIGVHWVWREVWEWDYFPAITEEEAIEIFLEMFQTEPSEMEIRLAYYAEPEDINQEFLQPYYIFDGTIIIDGQPVAFKTQMISATSFSPRATIVMPDEDSRFLANETIMFSASVTQGTPPYYCIWESDIDGILYEGESESFETNLSVGSAIREGMLLPHTISLTTFDSLNQEVSDSVIVVVTNFLGDVNGDSKVDILDIATAAQAFGTEPGNQRWDYLVDMNSDKRIDILDIATIAQQFGEAQLSNTQHINDSGFASAIKHSSVISCLYLGSFVMCLGAIVSLAIKRKKRRWVGILLAAVFIGGTFTVTLFTSINAQPNDDDFYPSFMNREVGIVWVKAYGWKGQLQNCDRDARGFSRELSFAPHTWGLCFDFGNWAAAEEDFKHQHAPLGGMDLYYIDTVDFAYFAGHGTPTSILFRTTMDSQTFLFQHARWGGLGEGDITPGEEGDLEWIVLDACQTLQWAHSSGNVYTRWTQAFVGLHYVFGFATQCADTGRQGPTFGRLLRYSWLHWFTTRFDWIRATQTVQSLRVRGAYLRAGNSPQMGSTDTFWDRGGYWGNVDPHQDPYPPAFFRWMSWQC